MQNLTIAGQERAPSNTTPIRDWGITRERIDEVVRRIVEVADPLKVIAFGSWARGEHGPESDLDVAVVLADSLDGTPPKKPRYSDLMGIRMSVDLIIATRQRHELFARSLNSVHHEIASKGVILYERPV